jgi:hypothetical protein
MSADHQKITRRARAAASIAAERRLQQRGRRHRGVRRLAAAQTASAISTATAIHTPRATRSRGHDRPMRARIHSSPIDRDADDGGQLLARHGAGHRAAQARRQHEGDVLTGDDGGERREHVRSTTATAAATRPARGPNAWWTRDEVPPGMSSAQLSMSIARANQPSTAVASTAQTVDGPRTGAATPATKNRPAPSCAIASAAAFHTDTNDRTAGVESTTRHGCGVRSEA